MRALALYLIGAMIMSIYGGQVCPLMDSLSVWELGLILLGTLAAAFAVRMSLTPTYVLSQPAIARSGRQFRLDIACFVGAGILAALLNRIIYHFPFLLSGSKLILGLFVFGLFAAIDLALEQERIVIRDSISHRGHLLPPTNIFPLTKKFSYLATAVMILATVVILLVISRDISWLSQQEPSAFTAKSLQHSVLVEIIFVMGILLGLLINLIISFSRNLNMLLANQTVVLERVSNGDMDGFVPVVTKDELGFIAGHTNTMIEGLKDRMRLLEGISVASEIQKNFQPSAPPTIPGLDIAGKSISCDETGGDYFDYIECSDSCLGKTAVLVGDVSGHGVGAALLMATARALIRQRADLADSPAACLRDVNRYLTRDTFGTGRFMSMFFLLMDSTGFTETGETTIAWVSAGHPPAILYDPADNSFTELKSEGLALGIMRDYEYPEVAARTFKPGQILLIGTDGLWETRNPNGDLLGKDRVNQTLAQHANKNAAEIVDAFLQTAQTFRSGKPQDDDLTLVVIKAKEGA